MYVLLNLELAVGMEFKNPLLQYIVAYVANFKSTVFKTVEGT